jgi:23S rRNA pseudouridine1911/1915/1917 synthase
MGNLTILYQDEDVLAIDKPAGIVVFEEETLRQAQGKTLIDYLLEEFPELKNIGKPPRHGIVHRLDKDTSGILLAAKNNRTLEFLQKQFKEGRAVKKYLALAVGNIKGEKGVIETLLGREPKERKKQKAYLPLGPDASKKGKRLAITEYRVLERYTDGKNHYTLAEIIPKTGRKHQIRAHFTYIGHPIAGDKIYGFKNQPRPKGLERQFLHAAYLEIELPNGEKKEFRSELPKELKKVIENLVIENF